MPVIREWRWNETEEGCDGVTLRTDSVTLWSANWRAPFTDAGRDWTIEEFRTSATSVGIPPNVWRELQEEVSKIGDVEE